GGSSAPATSSGPDGQTGSHFSWNCAALASWQKPCISPQSAGPGWGLNGGPCVSAQAAKRKMLPPPVSPLSTVSIRLSSPGHVFPSHAGKIGRWGSAPWPDRCETEERQRTLALYEHVFLARQDLSSQQVDALVEQYKGVIEENGGKIGRVENWGLKSLAYRVKKNRKAYFTLMDLDAPAAAVKEMER